jgi:hypothetical protein
MADQGRRAVALPFAEGSEGLARRLEDGTIDIVVGTHKLLSASVKFKRLGLLVIDEEHRFGVRHKEAIKAMRAEVDVLTLTATTDPAHARHGARRAARPVGDRDRAAAPPRDQDLRAQRETAARSARRCCAS